MRDVVRYFVTKLLIPQWTLIFNKMAAKNSSHISYLA